MRVDEGDKKGWKRVTPLPTQTHIITYFYYRVIHPNCEKVPSYYYEIN